MFGRLSNLTKRSVERRESVGARAKLILGKSIQRPIACFDRLVQVRRIRIDVNETGEYLTPSFSVLNGVDGGNSVKRVPIFGQFAKMNMTAVVHRQVADRPGFVRSRDLAHHRYKIHRRGRFDMFADVVVGFGRAGIVVERDARADDVWLVRNPSKSDA